MITDSLLTILIVLAIIGAIALLVEHWPRTDEQRHAAQLARFNYENRHKTFEERQGEIKLRVVAARLRRTVSDHALTNPGGWRDFWIDGVRVEVLQLAHHDKALAKQFLAWAEKATTEEVLYPDALTIVTVHALDRIRRRPVVPVHEDEIAALRVQP